MPLKSLSPTAAALGLVVLIGALAGIASVSVTVDGGPGQDRAERDWQRLVVPAAVDAERAGVSADALTGRLIETGFFGDADALRQVLADRIGAAADAGEAGSGADAGPAAFPPILAVAEVDGDPLVFLLHDDGRILGYGPGSEPVTGWQIVEISLDAVRTRYQQENPETRPVFRRSAPAAQPSGSTDNDETNE